jgi:hypothetical protein
MMSETLGRLVAAGNVAEVFEWGAGVVKLYRSATGKPAAFREAANHAAVEALGLPVPAVWSVQQIGGRWGIVFEKVNGTSFAAQMRDDLSATSGYLEILARLHASILSHAGDRLGSQKVRLATNIARREILGGSRKQELLRRLADNAGR